MPEGFLTSDGAGAGVYDNKDSAPEPTSDAPRGWTWNRKAGRWQPKVRGPVIWAGPQLALAGSAGDADPDPVQDNGGFSGGTPDRDPDPGWADAPAPARFEISAEDRKDIKALVALLYTVPAETLPLVDPYCFGPLGERETANGVIDAVADIVAGSPRVARWAVSAAGLMPVVKLCLALKPIAVNFLHHHITHSVEVELDRETRTMTVAKADWSQYPAA